MNTVKDGNVRHTGFGNLTLPIFVHDIVRYLRSILVVRIDKQMGFPRFGIHIAVAIASIIVAVVEAKA